MPGEGPVDIRTLASGLVNETCQVARAGHVYSLRVGSAAPGVEREWECKVMARASAAGLAPALRCCEPEAGIMVADWVPSSPWSAARALEAEPIRAMAALLQRVHALAIPQPPRTMNPASWAAFYGQPERLAATAGGFSASVASGSSAPSAPSALSALSAPSAPSAPSALSALSAPSAPSAPSARSASSARSAPSAPSASNASNAQSAECSTLRAAADARLAQLAQLPAAEAVLCHGDLHRLNVVGGERLLLLDWEYAHVSDPYWDLAGWIANNDGREDFAADFLEAYLERPANPQEAARLKLLVWLYDYVCLLWSALQFRRGSGAAAGVAARAKVLEARLAACRT